MGSMCLWIALLLMGARPPSACCGSGWAWERCLVLRRLRLPEWLLRPIRRWLLARELPVQLEALGIDGVEIGWSAKGCLVVGLRGIRVVLASSSPSPSSCCQGLEAEDGGLAATTTNAGAAPAAKRRTQNQKAVPHGQGKSVDQFGFCLN